MTNLEVSNVIAIATTSLLASLLVYVWTAIALGVVFRKCGEPAWKAWVPVLNVVVLFRLARLSPWLVLLFLIPFAGWIALTFAAHRINLAFGYGGGMTVVAFFLFPIWASIVGFGSERWVGHEAVGEHGPVRTPLAGVPDAAAELPDAVTAYSPAAQPPAYGSTSSPAPVHAGGWAPPPPASTAASGPEPAWAPPSGLLPSPYDADPPAWTPAPASASAPSTPVFEEPADGAPADEVGDEFVDEVVEEVAPAPAPAPAAAAPAAAAPASARPAPAPDAPISAAPPASVGPVSAAAPVAFVRRSANPFDASQADPDDADIDDSWSFDLAGGSATSEVTGAFTDAPPPVSAAPAPAPARRVGDAPAQSDAAPPVTSVPTASGPVVVREPWAPAPSPVPSDGEALTDSSDSVSAVVGAPDAGGPRSALSSVSALHTQPHIPEEDDDIEQTVLAKRKRTEWTLTGPGGARVPLTSDVVLLGRRPARDPEHPNAQLVSLDDDTRTVSKTHARLELRGERWFITDLDSTNGVVFATLLGTEVAAAPGEATEAGDRFLLGDAEVSLRRSEP